MPRRSILVALLLSGVVAASIQAQATTVVLVRHGEKTAPSGDPDLSELGRHRAGGLAAALRQFKLSSILVSQYKRTRQTADSTAEAQNLVSVTIAAGADMAGHTRAIATAVKAAPPGSAVLVVGHSNTLGPIIVELGGPKIPDLCDGEYSTMLLLELPAGAAPRLLRTNYGAADPSGSHDCAHDTSK